MPVVDFEVIVGVSADMAKGEQVAIAEATRYLAYCDQTDTFGYGGRVFSVEVYGGGGTHKEDAYDWGIGIQFEAGIENDDALKAFMDEMSMLAHVESVEIIGGEKPPVSE